MVEIIKKDLVEKQFIPYEITIKVNSREDHNELIAGCKLLKTEDWYFFRKRVGLNKLAAELHDIIYSHDIR